MTRRRKGTGTIERTREGLYRARYAFTPNKREEIDGSPFSSYEEAESGLTALLLALTDAGADLNGITLRKLGEKSFRQRELEGYRAVDGDQDVWDLRWEPWELASFSAASITRGDVKARLAGMRKQNGKPLATQTKRNALNVLRAVFAHGVDAELLSDNPCTGLKVKDHGRTSDGSTFLTADEAEALITSATDPGVALKIGTGMRSGELRSLRWEDVHEASITVRYGSPEEPCKSGRIREIPILPIARAALLELRKPFGDKAPAGIVLPSLSGWYRARGQVFDRMAWKAWLKAAGLTRRVRPHDLRHTCATLLLVGAWGDPWTYEAVKEMLGHSSVKVTERYARATGTLAQRAAAAMDKPAVSPQAQPNVAAQAREIIGRRGWDSNPRMTVLQSQHEQRNSPDHVALAGLLRAYLQGVADGDPHAHARGLDLASAVADHLDAYAAVASNDEARTA